ncbi:hypothetical protein BaRGS_00000048 [Batillaria attramentaria]|uniref:Secreted protein n=1 Tax=Batillaria attramentaria TaxID=370345 RepID=A0ABD0MAX6_9CAEN
MFLALVFGFAVSAFCHFRRERKYKHFFLRTKPQVVDGFFLDYNKAMTGECSSTALLTLFYDGVYGPSRFFARRCISLGLQSFLRPQLCVCVWRGRGGGAGIMPFIPNNSWKVHIYQGKSLV